MQKTVTTEEYWRWRPSKQFLFDEWLTRRFGSGWSANNITKVVWNSNGKVVIEGVCHKPGWDDMATPSAGPQYWVETIYDSSAPSPYGA